MRTAQALVRPAVLVACALASYGSACGGIVEHDNRWIQDGAGGTAAVKDASVGLDAEVRPEADAGHGGAEAGQVDPPDGELPDAEQETEPSCSMPVGEPAFGCPLVVAPVCGGADFGFGSGKGSCEIPLPTWTPITNDELPFLNVLLGSWDEPVGMLLRVTNESECATTGNGWYLDDPKQPTTIHICANACQCAAAAQQEFHARIGCWVHAAPGVVDAEIPCPKCASSRPQGCSHPQFSELHRTVLCRFTLDYLDLPPQPDPKLINLAYGAFGPVFSNAGYLQWIPSLDECDKVDEGWTLDTSVDPMVIEVCPSACSCAKVNGDRLMPEYGCPRYEGPGGP